MLFEDEEPASFKEVIEQRFYKCKHNQLILLFIILKKREYVFPKNNLNDNDLSDSDEYSVDLENATIYDLLY